MEVTTMESLNALAKDISSKESSLDVITNSNSDENSTSCLNENESKTQPIDNQDLVGTEIPSEDPLILDTIDITPDKCGGVLKQVLKEGEGDELPGYGDRVSLHYTGWLMNSQNPVMFDSSRKGEKCEFSLGRGMVIKGWDLGIATMKKGEVAVFICQPQYAYGDMGSPPKIPPYTPLLFEVELYGWKLEDLSPKKDNGILRKVLRKGDGSATPNEGSKVNVKLVGYFKDEIFDEGEKSFVLGEGCNENIPEGLELALLRFCINEQSIIYLQSKYGFEDKGAPEYGIPPDADLKYEVTLLSFKKVKDVWEMNSDEKFEKAKVSKQKGVSFVKVGNYKVALKHFKWIITCLENEPGVPADSEKERKMLLLSGYLNMALCFLKLENYVDAIKVCDKALVLDAKNEKALFRRGQARLLIKDCEEALQDFESLCNINPENKAARNCVILSKDNIKKQKLKDKSIYNKMFEKFLKQDEEKLRNMKTETGVWESDEREAIKATCMSETERLIHCSNKALLDGNVIELSNTAH